MYQTKLYQNLELSNVDLYSDGMVKSGFPTKKYSFFTKYGELIPQYRNDRQRDKTGSSLEFFKTGELKKISLQNRIAIQTEIGKIPAELILFYKGGKLRKIFPLNGKLSGFWTEKEEYSLAEKVMINNGKYKFYNKLINVEFYESQKLKRIVVWPKERIDLEVNGKVIKVKNGISFFENGTVKSFEPAEDLLMDTSIGKLNVQNSVVNDGLGNKFSTELNSDGTVKKIVTTKDRIKVFSGGELFETIEPELIPSWCNEQFLIPDPLEIEFDNDKVKFGGKKEFDIREYDFKVINNAIETKKISFC
ncbi:MAG: hypothetical protein ACQERZ_08660 [Fusobacteriota bacterium]